MFTKQSVFVILFVTIIIIKQITCIPIKNSDLKINEYRRSIRPIENLNDKDNKLNGDSNDSDDDDGDDDNDGNNKNLKLHPTQKYHGYQHRDLEPVSD